MTAAITVIVIVWALGAAYTSHNLADFPDTVTVGMRWTLALLWPLAILASLFIRWFWEPGNTRW